MNIRKVSCDKKAYLDLLLLADEQEDMIDRYLGRGEMLVLDDDGVKAECVITKEAGDGVYELKNIAVSPAHQRKGYGKRLIESVFAYHPDCDTLFVGTGDCPSALSFYHSCGFTESHRVKNFFTDNYDHVMYEDGAQLVDMVYLKRTREKQLSLRPFCDRDLGLFKKWLRADHVARWYERPADWIDEINKRNGEFSWIRHFIAEYGGKPIGFCQYYEYRRSGETWHGDIRTDGAYSIDYLIGEPDFIGKGLGKKLIAALLERIALHDGARLVIVRPDPENKASRGALLSVGFTFDRINGLYSYRIPK